jgi:hypothetical protein
VVGGLAPSGVRSPRQRLPQAVRSWPWCHQVAQILLHGGSCPLLPAPWPLSLCLPPFYSPVSGLRSNPLPRCSSENAACCAGRRYFFCLSSLGFKTSAVSRQIVEGNQQSSRSTEYASLLMSMHLFRRSHPRMLLRRCPDCCLSEPEHTQKQTTVSPRRKMFPDNSTHSRLRSREVIFS